MRVSQYSYQLQGNWFHVSPDAEVSLLASGFLIKGIVPCITVKLICLLGKEGSRASFHYLADITFFSHMCILIDIKEAFDKNPTHFHDRYIQQTRNRSVYLNMINDIFEKPITIIFQNTEWLKTFYLISDTRKQCLFSPILLNIALGVLVRTNRQNINNNNNTWDWRGRSKIISIPIWNNFIDRKS